MLKALIVQIEYITIYCMGCNICSRTRRKAAMGVELRLLRRLGVCVGIQLQKKNRRLWALASDSPAAPVVQLPLRRRLISPRWAWRRSSVCHIQCSTAQPLIFTCLMRLFTITWDGAKLNFNSLCGETRVLLLRRGEKTENSTHL